MSGGQQADFGQGSFDTGNLTVRLRSRKAGSGSASFPLTGSQITSQQGSATPSFSNAMSGSASTASPGSMTSSGQTQNDPQPFKHYRGGVQIAAYTAFTNTQSALLQSGDVIKVAAGNYAPLTSSQPGFLRTTNINVNTITFEWLTSGSRPFIDMSGFMGSSGQSESNPLTFGADCRTITVRGLGIKCKLNGNATYGAIQAFPGYQQADLHSFAAPAYDLYVEDCYIVNANNGMLISPNWNGRIHTARNVFQDCSAGDQSHGVYISEVAFHEATGDTYKKTGAGVSQANVGHLFKSRAAQLRVKACMFDSIVGGQARSIDYSNGGDNEITGCIFQHGDDATISSRNGTIAFAPEQEFNSSGTVIVLDGRNLNQRLLFAQNTIKDHQSYSIEMLQWYDTGTVPSYKPQDSSLVTSGTALGGSLNTIQLASGAPTIAVDSWINLPGVGGGGGYNRKVLSYDVITGTATLTSDWPNSFSPTSSTPYKVFAPVTAVTVNKTIRGNVVSAKTAANATQFVTLYGSSNSSLPYADVSNTGTIATPITGANADATLQYVGEFIEPVARTDSYRGAIGLPAWVTTTEWAWTQIPSSTFSNYFKNDGTGIAPSLAGYLIVNSGDSPQYSRIWADSGPHYSRKRRELYIGPAGGHSATEINIMGRWNLWKDTPDMEVVESETAWSIRAATWSNGTVPSGFTGYYSDGRPIAHHSYHNHVYFDDIDEKVCIGLYSTNIGPPQPQSYQRVAGYPRDGSWRADGYWPDVPGSVGADNVPLVFMNYDQTIAYQAQGTTFKKLDGSSRVWTTLNSSFSGYVQHTKASLDPSTNVALNLNCNGTPFTASGSYGARFLNCSTGAETAVTSITGASYPTGLTCVDVQWIPHLSGWIGFYAAVAGAAAAQWQLRFFQKTGAASLAISDITPASAPTTLMQRTGMFYAPDMGCLIFSSDYNQPLYHIRLGASLP